MASISTATNGTRRILFLGLDGKRRTIYCGKSPKRVVEEVARHVEVIVSCAAADLALDPRTADWLGRLSEAWYAKLVAAELVVSREATPAEKLTLGTFLRDYIHGRTDVKAFTAAKYETARRALVAHFGEHRPLASITPGDADAFRRAYAQGTHRDDGTFKQRSENTVRKIIAAGKLFFRGAVRLRLLRENPFADQKATILANPKRLAFIDAATIRKVMDAAPNDEWRLVIALARYGGVRVPSELGLRWDDVNWGAGKLRIRSPKTAHHEGKDERWIPLFPELRTALNPLWEKLAPGTPGEAFVLPSSHRDADKNLRQGLFRIIDRAGVARWAKLFQNLRSSRETELAQSFPLHVVTAWLGNSQPVAMKHYLQVRDEDFARAANPASSATQNPTRHVSEGGGITSHGAPGIAENPLKTGECVSSDGRSGTRTPTPCGTRS